MMTAIITKRKTQVMNKIQNVTSNLLNQKNNMGTNNIDKHQKRAIPYTKIR
jgi:hypothetical protein